jgi:hypothetical protein
MNHRSPLPSNRLLTFFGDSNQLHLILLDQILNRTFQVSSKTIDSLSGQERIIWSQEAGHRLEGLSKQVESSLDDAVDHAPDNIILLEGRVLLIVKLFLQFKTTLLDLSQKVLPDLSQSLHFAHYRMLS